MKKYLIKYSYIPDDGVPIIKTDYAIVEAKSTEKAKQIFIASFPNFKILKSCIKNKIQNKYDKIKVPKNAVHLFINYHLLYYIFLTNHSTKAFASPFSNEFILNICELGFLNNV